MSFAVREGKFDVVVASAPGVELWPSPGVRAVTTLCAEMGLSVGIFGGEDLRVRGVLPLPGTGGILLAEDVQSRIHRIQARAIVKFSPLNCMPDPFPGWRSRGLIPLPTAQKLLSGGQLIWDPVTVILGSGNRALRFGSDLLESGVAQVYCAETNPQWGAKRFAAWEVERRRFEMAGGKLIEARPLSLSERSPGVWEIRLQDAQGVRVLEIARVVSAGPFGSRAEVREHPAGSALFELEQTAGVTPAEDMEGWVNEEERGRWLGAKIVRTLASDLGSRREEFDRIYRRSRNRMKRYARHFEEPFTPSYQGKWIAASDARRIRSFSGVPQKAHRTRAVASVECFEEIPCNLCQVVCPTQAIEIGIFTRKPGAVPGPVFREDRCTSCGLCLYACPSGAIIQLEDREDRPTSRLTLPWRGQRAWKPGEFATLINRRGEALGSARVVGVSPAELPSRVTQLVQLDVPAHLVWEARSLRRTRGNSPEDEAYLASIDRASRTDAKIEITLDGEKRLVRDQIPLSLALFETGRNRPQDALFCRDGSCGLCQIWVDGSRKLACQTTTHRGMAVKLEEVPQRRKEDQSLCPCAGVTEEEVRERLRNGHLQSPEAVLSVTHVGEGTCHGRLCMDSFRRMLKGQGLEVDQWIDWRFPWSEWELSRN